jgi:O-antigen/teichoic acid export membrane protein
MSSNQSRATSELGRPGETHPSILSGTALNLLGSVAPLLAAVAAFPILNRYLGTERVGFLTLAWAVIGYLGLFDLGLGRALTKLVAERAQGAVRDTVPRLVWTAVALMLVLGVVAALAMALAAGWLVEKALRIPPDLQPDAIAAVRVLAVSVPFVITSAGLRGVLEGQSRFMVVNAVRAPMGIWLVAGPLLILPFGSRSLAWIATLLVIGRIAAWIAYAVGCTQGIPGLLARPRIDLGELAPLLRFGGWMTVTNVISPLLVYLDRFLLGSRVSLEAVAWYAMPWEMVTKILVVPGAVVTVLFPLFSGMAASRRTDAAGLYVDSVRTLAWTMFLPCFLVSLFAREGLTLWLGPDFAGHAYRVAQLMALGTLLNGVAHVPFALMQGAGRPDLTARIHLLELPVYIALMLWLTAEFGIAGTALAWTARVAIDLTILHVLARREVGLKKPPGALAWGVTGAGFALFAATLMPMPLAWRAALLSAAIVGMALVGRTLPIVREAHRKLGARLRGSGAIEGG